MANHSLSEAGARVRPQILKALGRGAMSKAELAERVDLGGKDGKFLQNQLTALRMAGQIRYSMRDGWSLGDGTPVGPQRAAAGTVASGLAGARDTSADPPSRIGAPAPAKVVPESRKSRKKPLNSETRAADLAHAREAAAEAPPRDDETPSVIEPIAADDGWYERRPTVSRIQIRIHLTLGPGDLLKLGDQAGEVLRAAAILIQAQETLDEREV